MKDWDCQLLPGWNLGFHALIPALLPVCAEWSAVHRCPVGLGCRRRRDRGLQRAGDHPDPHQPASVPPLTFSGHSLTASQGLNVTGVTGRLLQPVLSESWSLKRPFPMFREKEAVQVGFQCRKSVSFCK